MLIPPRYNHCIWCSKEFAIAGFKARAGHVLRSLEHIIPFSLFGHVLTEDVCGGCNTRLGTYVDHHLLNDGRIFIAGLAAGFQAGELLKVFRVKGTTPEGESFEYRVSNGNWRLVPDFTAFGFKIGSVEGISAPKDLENAKKKMLKLVLAQSQGLSERDAKKAVDDLFKAVEKDPRGEVYDPAIGQGIRVRPVPARGTISIVTQPWETQWCIAKMAYETGAILLGEKQKRIVRPALEQLKTFVETRKPMHGVFEHRSLKCAALPTHRITIILKGSSLQFCVRLFGREQWTVSFQVFKRHKLAEVESYRIEVVNSRNTAIRIVENNTEVTFG